MLIRLAQTEDVAALAALDARCNPVPWSVKQFLAALNSPHDTVLLAWQDKQLAGFAVWQTAIAVADVFGNFQTCRCAGMVGVGFGGLVLTEQGNVDFGTAIADEFVVCLHRPCFSACFMDFHATVIGDCADRVAH